MNANVPSNHTMNLEARGRQPERDTGEKYAVPLSEPAALRTKRVGSKAANLARLLQAGFPVPDGFVVTDEAFEQFLGANGLGPNTSPEAVLAASLPEDIADALRGALSRLGDARLAVRSSGIAEDLPGASFAGQYDTVLDVRGASALLAAVRRCWASAFGTRVVAYRAAQEQEGAVTMAVLRSRIRGAVEAVRSDKAGTYIRQWHTAWKAELASAIARLRSVNLPALSDEELNRHIGDVIGFFRHSLDVHTRLNVAVLSALAEVAFVCRDLLGWDDRKTFELFSGLSEKSSEPSRRLAELASMAGTRPAVRALLEQIDDQTAALLAGMDREFAETLSAYQREFGCRTLGEITEPTLAESPRLILGLIRDQLRRGYDPVADAAALQQRRAATIAAARAALTTRSDDDRKRFERALARGEQAYPIREDNQFYAVSAPMALVRYAMLETGRRLADRRQLIRRDDVFFLDPPEARFLMDGLLWATSRVFAADHGDHRQSSENMLRGIAASPGTYTGPVRIIMSESEFHKLQPGDVLVCPMTSPVWSVLFPSIGALVTDSGGVLSHPAIIAREYRVPAVVATGHATSVLHDGQKITVDGSTGVVEAQP